MRYNDALRYIGSIVKQDRPGTTRLDDVFPVNSRVVVPLEKEIAADTKMLTGLTSVRSKVVMKLPMSS